MENKVKPITPKEAAIKSETRIPDYVILAVNKLIEEKFDGVSAIITQEEVLGRIVNDDISRSFIFDKKYLDFEEIYRKEGWKVVYDKPGYNESYTPYWKFSI